MVRPHDRRYVCKVLFTVERIKMKQDPEKTSTRSAIDNWYISLQLANTLLNADTLLIGTIRKKPIRIIKVKKG